VIAFPKSATGRDLLVDAPARVTDEQLKEYKIALANEA
jgi:aspartyl-tRNA synthetase